MKKVSCPIREQALINSESLAIVTSGLSINYRSLNSIVTQTCGKLEQKKIIRGRRIAILSENSFEYAVIFFALFRIGAVACPLETRLTPILIRKKLLSIGCQSILISSKLKATLDNNLGEFELFTIEELVTYEEGSRPAPINSKYSSICPDQDATILFTSGTTGLSKAVLHTYENHWYSAMGSNREIQIGLGDRWYVSLPLYHIGGLAILFRCFSSGAAVVVLTGTQPESENLELYRITHLSLVPTQLLRILSKIKGKAELKHLKFILLGGDSIPSGLVEKAISVGLPVCSTYGSTELASQITTTLPTDPSSKRTTAGKLLSYRKLKIGPDGEIYVKGQTLFKEYINADSRENIFDGDGWFRSGDLGLIDSEQYLTILGRKDNMFISGGENIFPEEIETAIDQTGMSLKAIIVPVPDPEFGQRPVAYVKAKIGLEVGSAFIDDLKKKLRALLPSYKIPIEFYDWPNNKLVNNNKTTRNEFKLAAKAKHK